MLPIVVTILFIAVVALAAFAVLYSGIFNVAATKDRVAS